MRRLLLCLTAVLGSSAPGRADSHPPAVTAPAATAPAVQAPAVQALADSDRSFLEGLLKQFLFDPQGAQRVVVPFTYRTVWAKTTEFTRAGWLVPGKLGQPARVYFTDGESIPAPPDPAVQRVDFRAACAERYANKPPSKEPRERVRQMAEAAVGQSADSDLALAAWLHRLGHDDLAAAALAHAGKDEPLARLRGELAWSAFARMVHAYMVRADEEAMEHGERLLRLYPTEAKAQFGGAEPLLNELKRRMRQGTFGKQPAKDLPADFASWDAARKTTYLINALDEVDARQQGQPGGIRLASDPRVKALIEVGDAAIPALIDTLEKDTRLTRSVHFWRDFSHNRTVLVVQEVALAAAMSILRVRLFTPVSTGDNLTSRGAGTIALSAASLRTYWQQYGRMPIEERMMHVLQNPQASSEARREAADNLGRLGQRRTLSTTVFSDSVQGSPERPNPALRRLNNPTAAEAILAAMDRELAQNDLAPHDSDWENNRSSIIAGYLNPLINLDDPRVLPEIVRRSQSAPSVNLRSRWAYAAHLLGDNKPLDELAAEFQAGKLKLPEHRDNGFTPPRHYELATMVQMLGSTGTPAAEAALATLATSSTHPYNKMTVACCRDASTFWQDKDWLSHPLCVRVFRADLDRCGPPAVGSYKIEDDRLIHRFESGSDTGSIPELLADPARRLSSAPERTCDVAARQLAKLVYGMPQYHALLKDAASRRKQMRTYLDRFGGSMRRLSARESQIVQAQDGLSDVRFLPDLRPLGRTATAADVKAGKALFTLGGKGQPAPIKLPAVASRKSDQAQKHPPQLLIVQAEVGQDGVTTYGFLSTSGPGVLPADALTEVFPLDQPAPAP